MHEELLRRSRVWAVRLRHNYVGCEHLLLVLVEEGKLAQFEITTDAVVNEIHAHVSNWVNEANALRAVGIDASSVRDATRRELGVDLRIRGLDSHTMLGLTARAQRVLDAAPTDDDVLLSMLREDTNLGVVVLERLAVPVDELRRSLE